MSSSIPTDKNRLSIVRPYIVKEWDYEKNYPLRPEDVCYGSEKRAWLKCKKCNISHFVIICSRNSPNQCPNCSRRARDTSVAIERTIANKIPSLIKYWHPEKNGILTPYNVGVKSNKIIKWQCPLCKTEWNRPPYSYRTYLNYSHACTNKNCINHKIHEVSKNSLLYRYPEIAKEWNYKKNGNITPDRVYYGSHEKYWWICPKGHEWIASVRNRAKRWKKRKRTKCPYCANKKVCEDNCFANKYPELAKEWHPTKNGDLTPWDVTLHSNKKVWWLCRKGHAWLATVNDRTWNHNCPVCRGYILKDNSVCASMVEAYFYLIFKEKNIRFKHNFCYNSNGDFGKFRYDFYIPSENKYLEVTSYSSGYYGWKNYKKKINKKRLYAINQLKANFEFIQMTLNKQQKDYVRENMKEYPSNPTQIQSY